MTQSEDKENQPIEASTTNDAAPLQKKREADGGVPGAQTGGNGTDNGGWKSKAITAAVTALVGSELESGGAPKSATSIRDHWDHLKRDFNNISTLLEKSGWGWDDENQCVDPRLASYRGKSFPIYDDMKELLEGALATGANAFWAGKDNSDSDTSSESGNEADANPDTSFENVVTPAKVLKRKVSALGETPATKKRSRDRTGRSSTAHSISDISRAIGNVAVAMNSGNGSSKKETKKLACQLVRVFKSLNN
ncbi:hypothetical protein K435DRAFT_805530 [Dendrothele bispora CBS 962.96]|uniref:Myb/SANT-like domain-containing protein n=1 Tax=Dendrothele bispora (strain CBS 962.96) TaxID=1314807 RepID=A0A4S8LB81_DENBC|nr:hypothetical protein K435DRAFT_805530 [Dendrothele bispora CBS 962.96]